MTFHLAISVLSLQQARMFYGKKLGLKEGRSAPTWVDFDFFGHQLSCHLRSEQQVASFTSAVDGKGIPIPHFGMVLPPAQFEELARRLEEQKVTWKHQPMTRFQGKPGEQRTMFVEDDCGNTLEFKSFASPEMIWEQ